MPQILRAHFLCYENFSRNADKVFNLFIIRDDDGTHRCITENGRRNSNLVVRTLCSKAGLATAESNFRQKLAEKRNHRETPYADDSYGHFISPTAKSHRIDNGDSPNYRQLAASNNAATATKPPSSPPAPQTSRIAKSDSTNQSPKEQRQPKKGVFNQEQLNSLEL